MDEERKSLLDSFLAGVSDVFSMEAQAEPMNDSPPSMPKAQMELPVSAPERPKANNESMSFNEAFATNRAAGNERFTWRGNEYTTELANG